jgi:hypothetical protein
MTANTWSAGSFELNVLAPLLAFGAAAAAFRGKLRKTS